MSIFIQYLIQYVFCDQFRRIILYLKSSKVAHIKKKTVELHQSYVINM